METVLITEQIAKEIAKTYLSELESEKSGDYHVEHPGSSLTYKAYITKQVRGSKKLDKTFSGGGSLLSETVYDYCYIINDFWVENENCEELIIVDRLAVNQMLTKLLN